ncbi:glycoside hydrolase family 31 protein [Prolixibacteraceae bacterium]|nr:glycoside hydrolase family 31 protein [Prolixibacteraceae bacterium]
MKKIHIKYYLLLFVALYSWRVQAQVSHVKVTDKKVLSFQLNELPIEISIFNPHTIEVKALEANKALETYALVGQNQHVDNITEIDGQVVLEGEEWIAKLTKQPFQLVFYNKVDLTTPIATLVDISFQNQQLSFDFKLSPSEQIYGGGSRALDMNRRGEKLKLHNEPHYSYGWGEKNLNFSQPLFISSNNYNIFYNSGATGEVDIASTKRDILSIGSGFSGNTIYITIGNSPIDLHHKFASLVGTAPLPPRWAMGNLMSRFGYTSQKQAEEMLDKMQQEQIPVDAIILDLYWFGYGQDNWRMGDLKWNTDSFPTHRNMIRNFKRKGVETILIAEPFILESTASHKSATKANALGLSEDGKPFVIEKFWFGKASLVDVFSKQGQEWLWQKYQPLIKEGVSAWWGDLGEPEMHPNGIHYSLGTTNEVHNIYGHYWSKLLSDKYHKLYPNKRLFHLNRAGFVGTQRFSSYPWSGDVSRSWRGLRPQVPIMLGLSMGQMPYASSDLGGFCAGPQNNELYTRWLQFGVFNPIYRPHGADVPSEVVEYPDSVKSIVKKAIELRYQLMPYNYTLAWEQAVDGTPLARPWFYENSIPKNMWNRSDVYMWGPSFLVYPILNKEVKRKELFLPNGIWFDFFTGERYLGNSNINMDITLENIPVFVKAGSFIPMVDTFQNSIEYSTKKLYVHYYADHTIPQSTYTWFNDDGENKNSIKNNLFETIKMEAKQSYDLMIISFDSKGHLYQVGKNKYREIDLVIHNVDNPTKVLIGNKDRVENSTWNSTQRTITITISDNVKEVKLIF